MNATETKHTPTPWNVSGGNKCLIKDQKGDVAETYRYHDADFIVRCVNSQPTLISTLEFIKHMILIANPLHGEPSIHDLNKIVAACDSAISFANGESK